MAITNWQREIVQRQKRKVIVQELMEEMPGLYDDVRNWVSTFLIATQREKTEYPFTKNEFAFWFWSEAHKVRFACKNTDLEKTKHIWDVATHLAEILSRKGLLAEDTEDTVMLLCARLCISADLMTEHIACGDRDALRMGMKYVDYCKSNHISLTEYQFNRDVRPLMRMQAAGIRDNMPELMYRIKYNDDYTKWVADAFWPYRKGAWTYDDIFNNLIWPLEGGMNEYAGYVNALWGKYHGIVTTGAPSCEQDMIDEMPPYYVITHDIRGNEVEDAEALANSMKQADRAADALITSLREAHYFDETREAFVREETDFVLSESFFETMKSRYCKRFPPYSIIPSIPGCYLLERVVSELRGIRHNEYCKKATYYDYEAAADAFLDWERKKGEET